MHRKILASYFFLILLFLGLTGFLPAAGDNLVLNEILIINNSSDIDPGTKDFLAWIELFNPKSSRMALDNYSLTFGKEVWKFPDGSSIAANGYLTFRFDVQVEASYIPLNPSNSGGTIRLLDSAGTLLDSLTYPAQMADVSYGRSPADPAKWAYFYEPTPGGPNTTEAAQDSTPLAPPRMSMEAGFYPQGIQVTLTSQASGAVVYYTTDGSIPTRKSSTISGPLAIPANTVLRARNFLAGKLPSEVVTKTYLIAETVRLPVFSLSTNPANLFDEKIGIYAYGENYEKQFPFLGANFFQPWERPLFVEFFNPAGQREFAFSGGVRIHGRDSRGFPQKSFKIYTRKRYGAKSLNYQLFPDKPCREYYRFNLRNSGGDWPSTMMRDSVLHEMVKNQMNVDWIAVLRCLVFLNGKYWGVMNLRERGDDYYPQHNFGLSPKQVDMISEKGEESGDGTHYEAMISYLQKNDIADVLHYNYIQTQMDVNEFIDYQIANIYIGNVDWPAGNVRLWRPRSPAGKWRWILYDLDTGWGFVSDVNHDTISFATSENGPVADPKSPESNYLFRRLLQNKDFKEEFIQRFAAHAAITFGVNRVTRILQQAKSQIEPEMPRHIKRWLWPTCGFPRCCIPDMAAWQNDETVMLYYAQDRAAAILKHFLAKFAVPGLAALTVQSSLEKAGEVQINGLAVPSTGFSAPFFRGIPIRLTAQEFPGYRFLGWEGAAPSNQRSIVLRIDRASSIKAVFSKTPSPREQQTNPPKSR